MREVYEVNANSVHRIRNAEIALKIASGEKIISVARQYGISITTARNALIKIARVLLFSFRRNQIVSEEEMEDLLQSEFKSELGIKHLKLHLEWATNYIPKSPRKLMLESHTNINAIDQLNDVSSRLNKLANKIDLMKNRYHKMIDKEFSNLEHIISQLNELLMH